MKMGGGLVLMNPKKKMNNIYRITFGNENVVGWDEYNGFVVIASTKKEARELCGVTKEKRVFDNRYETNIKEIKKIGETRLKKGIVLESFNAG